MTCCRQGEKEKTALFPTRKMSGDTIAQTVGEDFDYFQLWQSLLGWEILQN